MFLRGLMHLIKTINWNCEIFKLLFSIVKLYLFLWWQSWIFSISVTRSFGNHSDMPICGSSNISYQCWKQLCCLIFLWKIIAILNVFTITFDQFKGSISLVQMMMMMTTNPKRFQWTQYLLIKQTGNLQHANYDNTQPWTEHNQEFKYTMITN